MAPASAGPGDAPCMIDPVLLKAQAVVALRPPRRAFIAADRRKGGKRRRIGMDRWAWEQLDPWRRVGVSLPVGALLCVMDGPAQGRPWSLAAVRTTLRSPAVRAGVRRQFARTGSGTRMPLRWRAKVLRSNVHTAPTRPREPRHHVRLPARNRQQQDHRDRGSSSGADAARERWLALAVVAQRRSGRVTRSPLARGSGDLPYLRNHGAPQIYHSGRA